MNAGTSGGPVEVKVKNTGDEDVYFVTLRAVQHPTAQVGSGDDTFAATALSETQEGNFVDELELGTLAPDAEVSMWVRWVVPASAPAGAVVWAVEALGSET